MKILITGCYGQLGRELNKLLSSNESYTIVASDADTLDICNGSEVSKFIKENNFDVVINCAAYTKVDLCETNSEIAYNVNGLGAKNIAIACEEIGAKVVYISTDYVFDGEKSDPYIETDITDPQSIYGKSKSIGEFYTRTFASNYFIVRTAWLYGDGDNFVKTMLSLSKKRDSLDVVNDQFGSPTSTKDLAICVANLINTNLYGIYHGTCSGSCSWYDFACKIFEYKNINIKVNPVTSDQFKTVAKRPKFSVLENAKLKEYKLDTFRNWEESLKDYLRK
ncbi:MAG: dTDP-4-dehydrorhamnose reductase [Romboutsia sp.]|uniref:dTDP-4-dehydrorhamnose reductase n=1 Tax=Romboutsia sp. TaxID=1965302 RepID=UPI003F3177A8